MKTDPLLHAFDGLVRRAPERPLVASPSQTATVGEVGRLADSVARRARDLGLAPGTTTVLLSPNGPAFLALLIGVRRSGSAVLLLDASAKSHEVERVVQRFGPVAIARCDAAWPDSIEQLRLDRGGPTFTAAPEGAAVIKLTSASTGEPRGIAASTEALMADDAALTQSMGLRTDDRLMATVPFSHSYGLSSLVLPALVRGTPLHVVDRPGPFAPLEVARRSGSTVFPTVPAYLTGLLRVGEVPEWPDTLRLVLSAGARLLPETAARFRERFARPVHVFYGASECGGITYDREGSAAERGTVGEPVAGVQLELRPVSGSSDSGEGRIVVRSPAVASGYVPVAEDRLDGRRFVSDDLGRRRGVELELVGRLNDLINVKGKKVNPVEIENVIAGESAVREVRVIGVPRPDGSEVVRAVVACRPGSLTEQQIVRRCRDRLSDYKVPRSVVLVERIPRNARGKVDRATLAGLGAVAVDGPLFD